MSLSGRVANIKIKNEKNPDDIRSFKRPKLQVSKKKSGPKVIITLSPDEDDVFEFNLNDCTYLENSSTPGTVDCIRIDSEKQTVIILDTNQECEELLEYVRNYLNEQSSSATTRNTDDEREREQERKRARKEEQREEEKREREQRETEKREREQREAEKRERERLEAEKRDRKPKRKSESESDSEPVQSENVNRLIRALNDNKAEDAAKIARLLAQKKESIRFTLDMINESGNVEQRQPKQPVVKPLELKLSIESFLIESCPDNQYNVAILPSATIKDLKQIVQRDAGVDLNQQYWYINRDLLPDNYKFDGTQAPRVNDNTVLTLYIAKP